MARYRKKPIVIEASRWFKNGDHPLDYSERGRGGLTEGHIVRYFRRPDVLGESMCVGTTPCGNKMHDHGWIDTLEGGHTVCPGDWIITGIKGEHYPCKPDIFEATYEPVERGEREGR